jgi:hypothetical protein
MSEHAEVLLVGVGVASTGVFAVCVSSLLSQQATPSPSSPLTEAPVTSRTSRASYGSIAQDVELAAPASASFSVSSEADRGAAESAWMWQCIGLNGLLAV